MRGNIVDINGVVPGDPSLYLVSEYSTDKWAPDAEHWIHTARHEAGHAVALLCMHRKFGRDADAFERILIRPGATGSYVTRRGRRSDCLGCVEHAGSERLGSPRELRSSDREMMRLMAINLEIKIVSNFAGPLAEMRSWNEMADLHSQEHRWAWEDNKEEIDCIGLCVAELRALTGVGTMESFERQSYDLVKREWSAVAALSEALMRWHSLEYDEALAVIEPWLTTGPVTGCRAGQANPRETILLRR